MISVQKYVAVYFLLWYLFYLHGHISFIFYVKCTVNTDSISPDTLNYCCNIIPVKCCFKMSIDYFFNY